MKTIQENELGSKLIELHILIDKYQKRIVSIDERIESIKKLKEEVAEYMNLNLVDAPPGTSTRSQFLAQDGSDWLARTLTQTSAEQMGKIKKTAPPPPPPNSPFSIIEIDWFAAMDD